jgi:hypothetical protein
MRFHRKEQVEMGLLIVSNPWQDAPPVILQERADRSPQGINVRKKKERECLGAGSAKRSQFCR